MTVKLSLVSHAATEATRSVLFPADAPINAVGHRELAKVDGTGLYRGGIVLSAPEIRTLDTASLLKLPDVRVESALRDVDYGRWTGLSMMDQDEDQLHSWLTDPNANPHGGESVSDVIARVSTWMASFGDSDLRVVAVTHPAVIRAAVVVALGAPAAAFWRIDVMPLSLTSMHRRGDAWTLRQSSTRLARIEFKTI